MSKKSAAIRPSAWERRNVAQVVLVAELVGHDLTNWQIGIRLGVSTDTVQCHLRKIFRKLRIRRRAELIALQRHAAGD